MRPISLHGLALVATLAYVLPLNGQEIRGRIVDTGDARGVAGANVLLLDAAGHRVAGWLTDSTGAFLLRAPGPGTFRVRAEMIGRRSVESGDVALSSDSVASLLLALPLDPVRLGAIDVTGARVCRARPDDGATQIAWDEARKALSNRQTLLAAGLYQFDIVRTERLIHPGNDRVLDEQVTGRTRTDTDPFISASPERLARDGYAEDLGDARFYLHGPTADVLLSQPFLDTHCFSVVRDRQHPGQLGLEFQPVPDRRVTDIRGVFWLDEATAVLRTLDFSYTRLPDSAPAGPHSGRAEFERLPNGGIIVRSWEIRTPVPDPGRPRAQRIVAFKSVSGAVVRIVARNPSH